MKRTVEDFPTFARNPSLSQVEGSARRANMGHPSSNWVNCTTIREEVRENRTSAERSKGNFDDRNIAQSNPARRFSVDFSKLKETTEEYWIDFPLEQSTTPITASQNFTAQKGKSLLMLELLRNCWSNDEGQDIAEY
ncbi:MAG TPA: hypothetical protein VFK81_11200, partial [Terriglobales bacterium]|nr:hypothetical protein [Terriglobales bacterium]